MTLAADKTLTEKAYRQLHNDILVGRLAAGSKLKLEGLGAEYKIGMSPLREALTRLVGDLLVVTEGQRGFWVAPLTLAELDDVSAVRELVETQALQQSIQRGAADWEEDVVAAFEGLAAIERDLPATSDLLDAETFDEWERRNRAFHVALVSACGSPTLLRLRVLLYQQSERYRRVSLNTSRARRNVHDEHAAIFEATMDRNVLKACRMTELHLRKTAEEVRRVIADLTLPSSGPSRE